MIPIPNLALAHYLLKKVTGKTPPKELPDRVIPPEHLAARAEAKEKPLET